MLVSNVALALLNAQSLQFPKVLLNTTSVTHVSIAEAVQLFAL